MQCGRSLLLWPLSSDDPVSLNDYFFNYPGMDQAQVDSILVDEITPCLSLPNSTIKNEHCVRTSRDRDYIRSHAARLAAHCGSAGMRLDIPEHLVSAFKTMEDES